MIINPKSPIKGTISHILSCNKTKAAKENDSVKKTQLIISKPKNNSKFNIKTALRTEARYAYLFRLKYPVNIIQYPNKRDSSDA